MSLDREPQLAFILHVVNNRKMKPQLAFDLNAVHSRKTK